MALKIKLRLEEGYEHPRLDRYSAREGDWDFEVYVPRGERPTTADVHFEFEDEEERDETKR